MPGPTPRPLRPRHARVFATLVLALSPVLLLAGCGGQQSQTATVQSPPTSTPAAPSPVVTVAAAATPAPRSAGPTNAPLPATSSTPDASGSLAQSISATTASATASAPPTEGDAASSPVVRVVQASRPGVVQVTNEQEAQNQRGQGTGLLVPQGAGTGFLIDDQGHVLTNNHVVAGAQRITVTTFDGRNLVARLVGADPRTDVAVLQIDPTGLNVLPLGDSSKLLVGQTVVAIGNALALPGGPTVTTGVVSALGRSAEEPPVTNPNTGDTGPGAFLFDLVQTDAAINPGNSGGPLLDLQGRVIGINTLGRVFAEQTPQGPIPAQGINFAIAINTAKPIADELIKNGKVVYGFMGISTLDNSPAIAARYGIAAIPGAVIQAVVPSSPAAQAGLQPKDLIIAIDGQPVRSTSDLRRELWPKRPGDQVSVTLAPPQQVPPAAAATVVANPGAAEVAGVKTRTVQITLAQQPQQPSGG